jgi:RNA polymerase sigma factor for flagellar operon FliA
MRAQPVAASNNRRIVAGLPFVEALARRMAATMPNSIDIGDLVQDGMIGLIDAAHRFDEDRGIKFETFAERRVRGAMIDALRRDAWPRGVRRQRRELDAAREALRRELGHEPSMADLAARVGSDEKRLSRTIVRINTIESTSPLATGEHLDESSLPPALVPSEPDSPDTAYEKLETRDRVRAAIQSLPVRERKVIGLYYYGEVTMKQIGAEIGVNESRVSQLHARAIRRLREALGAFDGARHAEDQASAPGRRRRTVESSEFKVQSREVRTLNFSTLNFSTFLRKAVSHRLQQVGEAEGLRQPAAAGLVQEILGVGAGDIARHEDDALAHGRDRR